MSRQVLSLHPRHANTLYNYAVLLDTHLKRKPEAEQYYRQTIELEPKHAYALYNLAVLLEEKYFSHKDSLSSRESGEEKKIEGADEDNDVKRKGVTEVALFYRRAAEADARDSSTIADYGR